MYGAKIPYGGRVRYLTPDAAMRDLNRRGVTNMAYTAVVVGGVWGYEAVAISRYFIHDSLVWEWEDRNDGVVRVYLVTWDDIKELLGRYI